MQTVLPKAYGEADVQPSSLPGYFTTPERQCQGLFSGKTGCIFGENGDSLRQSAPKRRKDLPDERNHVSTRTKIPSVYEQSMGAHRSSVPFNGEIPTPACGLARNDALIGEHLGMTRNRGENLLGKGR